MLPFQFDPNELLSFFAVLTRISVLVAVLPFLGDKLIPPTIKALLALAMSIAVFPALVSTGSVQPGEAAIWGANAFSLVITIATEVAFALILGFGTKLVFDSILIGGNLAGTFMGFAAASQFDPQQETQTEVVARLQMAIAMLIFLAVDGPHLMILSAVQSYSLVGIGKAHFGAAVSQTIIEMSFQSLQIAVQLAAPMAVSLFAVNVIYGVLAKAIPQMNILVISFAISALIGLIVLFLSFPGFFSSVNGIMDLFEENMQKLIAALSSR